MIKKLLNDVYKHKADLKKLESGPTPNRFRAGNIGYIASDGEVTVGCHRKAMARALGITPFENSVNPYFEVGFANEAYIASLLPAQTEHYDSIKFDDKAALSLSVDNIVISGTPDVQFFKDGKLVAGGELKAHSSGNQLEDPFISGTPKDSNLLQAALYSYMSKVPFYLLNKAYTKPTYMKKGTVFSSSEVEFKVFIDEKDRVMYTTELGETLFSGFRVEGILDYYKLCQELIDTKQLYKPPFNAKSKYKHEDYCTECKAAEKINHNYEKWIELLKKQKEDSDI